MQNPGYSRETTDAKFEALKHEFKAGVEASTGQLRSEIDRLRSDIEVRFGDIRADIAGLRGEIKVWLIIVVLLITPIANLAANRAAAVLWPVQPTSHAR